MVIFSFSFLVSHLSICLFLSFSLLIHFSFYCTRFAGRRRRFPQAQRAPLKHSVGRGELRLEQVSQALTGTRYGLCTGVRPSRACLVHLRGRLAPAGVVPLSPRGTGYPPLLAASSLASLWRLTARGGESFRRPTSFCLGGVSGPGTVSAQRLSRASLWRLTARGGVSFGRPTLFVGVF